MKKGAILASLIMISFNIKVRSIIADLNSCSILHNCKTMFYSYGTFFFLCEVHCTAISRWQITHI